MAADNTEQALKPKENQYTYPLQRYLVSLCKLFIILVKLTFYTAHAAVGSGKHKFNTPTSKSVKNI